MPCWARQPADRRPHLLRGRAGEALTGCGGWSRRATVCGVGRLILALCQEAARAEGFARAELVAALAGEPLHRACGYRSIERFAADRGGAPVPLVRMSKAL